MANPHQDEIIQSIIQDYVMPRAPLDPEMQFKLDQQKKTQDTIRGIQTFGAYVAPVSGEYLAAKETKRLIEEPPVSIQDGRVVPNFRPNEQGLQIGLEALGIIPIVGMAKRGATKVGKKLIGKADEVSDLVKGIVRDYVDAPTRAARAKKGRFTTDAFHGSTHDIKAFDASVTNPESDWGKGIYSSNSIDDVNPNYAGEGPDLTQRIEIMSERISDDMYLNPKEYGFPLDRHGNPDLSADDIDLVARQAARAQLKGNEGVVYPLKINTKKYATIGGDDSTKIVEEIDWDDLAKSEIDRADFADDFEFEDAVRERAFELQADDPDSLTNRVFEAMQDTDAYDQDQAAMEAAMNEIYDRTLDGQLDATELDDIIRSNVPFIENDAGEMLGGGHTTAQVLKNLGFEGIIDNTVDVKFGSSRKMGQMMEGVYPDTQHIITFPGSEHTIRSTNAMFDPKKKLSKDILAGGAAAAVGTHYLMNRDSSN